MAIYMYIHVVHTYIHTGISTVNYLCDPTISTAIQRVNKGENNYARIIQMHGPLHFVCVYSKGSGANM